MIKELLHLKRTRTNRFLNKMAVTFPLATTTAIYNTSNNNTIGILNTSLQLQQKQQHHFAECYSSSTMVYLNYSLGISVAILGLFSFLGNITMCIMMTAGRRSTFKKVQYALVFMLALADLLNTVISLPMEVASYLTYNHDQYVFSPTATIFQNAIWYTLTSLSISSLMLISVEKLITIYFPFKYVYIITKRTVMAAIACIWLHAVVTFTCFWCLQRWPEDGYYDFYVPRWFEDTVILFNFVLPSIVNFISYGYIFKTLIQHSRKIASPFSQDRIQNENQQLQQQQQQQQQQPQQSQQQHHHHHKYIAKLKSDLRLARNLRNTRPFIYLGISFFFLLLPFIVYQVYLTFHPDLYYTCGGELVDSTLSMVTFGNSVGNVFIYGTSNSRFRNAFRKMVGLSADMAVTQETATSCRRNSIKNNNNKNTNENTIINNINNTTNNNNNNNNNDDNNITINYHNENTIINNNNINNRTIRKVQESEI